MPVLRHLPRVLAPAILLASCSPLPKQMPGLYWAETQDYIRVNRDGSMYWSPPAKDFSRETFVGIISVKGNDPATAHVVRPSASPFVFSDFKFAADGSTIDVDWKWRAAHRKPRGSHYTKNP